MSYDGPTERECPCCDEIIPINTYPCPECGATLDMMYWAIVHNAKWIECDELRDSIHAVVAELVVMKDCDIEASVKRSGPSLRKFHTLKASVAEDIIKSIRDKVEIHDQWVEKKIAEMDRGGDDG